MGLCAYGQVKYELLEYFANYISDKNFKNFSNGLNIGNLVNSNPWENPLNNWLFEGKKAFDIAATAQRAFENKFLSNNKKI